MKNTDLKASPTTAAAKQLKSYVERIERLEEDKTALSNDIQSVYHGAKSEGFDTKVLKTVIRLRRKDPNERQEESALLETYLEALGME